MNQHPHHHHRRPKAPPKAIDESSSTKGLRAVATFEAIKGAAVLALALGLLHWLHRDLGDSVENLLAHLHINTEHRVGASIVEAASKMTDARLWGFAAGALAYAMVLWVEAWGLWNRRVWGEWFALLSGALYLPLEIAKLVEKPNAVHATVFLVNVAILAYMLEIRLRSMKNAAVE